MATQFAKAPAGILTFLGETTGFPQREAEGLRPRLDPGKDHRLVISRSAALSPGPGVNLEGSDLLVFFEK
jgi:hypothetical protein